METEFTNIFNEDVDELDVMAGFYEEKTPSKSPKNSLCNLKKLRVRVKRLPQSVVQRYLKKKSSRVGSSQPLVKRPRLVQKPYPQQLIVNKSHPQIRQLVKSAASNGATKLIGQGRQSGSFTIKSPISVASQPKTQVPLKNFRAPTKSCRPNKTKQKAAQEEIAVESPPPFMINNSKVVDTKSNNCNEVQDCRRAEKMQINSMDIISSKTHQPSGSFVTKIVNGKKVEVRSLKITKPEATSPTNIINIEKEGNIPDDADKSSSVKIPLKTLQQIQSRQTKFNKKHSDLNRSKVKSVEARNTIRVDISKINSPSVPEHIIIKKAPQIVKVPVSKLINISQGLENFKCNEKEVSVGNSLNNVQNISKVVSSGQKSTSNVLRMPVSYKHTKQTKSPEVVTAPQTIQISKVVKSPNMLKIVKLPVTLNLPEVKLLNPNFITNFQKSGEKVISKVPKIPEAVSTTSNITQNRIGRSVYTQTEANDQTSPLGNTYLQKCQTKTTQTRFTCNNSIGAIIDTTDFSISCFYCYDVFPIKTWPTFIRHMQTYHRLEEKSQEAAKALLTAKNIIPYGMKSKEVQVNTLKGRNIGGGKRHAEQIGSGERDQNNFASIDDMESVYNNSQLDNDLEMALNYLDTDESDAIGEPATEKFEKIKLINYGKQTPTVVKTKSEQTLEMTIIPKIEPAENAVSLTNGVFVNSAKSEALKSGNRPFFQNKIINLPPNIKIIRKLPNCEIKMEHSSSVILPKTPEASTENNKPKIFIKKFCKPIDLIKTEDANESWPIDTTIESIDPYSEDILEKSRITNTKDNFQLAISCLNNSAFHHQNTSVDTSKIDVEQNVKIEPQYDNKSDNERDILKSNEEKLRYKVHVENMAIRTKSPQQKITKSPNLGS